MTLLHRLQSIVRWIARRDRAEHDLNDELQAFVDMAAADRVRDGVTGSEAHRLAVLQLGGIEQAKERVRAARHGGWIDEFGRDVGYGFRQIRRNPVFSAIVIATLALGIGVNTAIFSVWNGVLYAPLPGVQRPDELVMLTDPGQSGLLRGRERGDRAWLTYAEFQQLQEHAGSFTGLMASQSRLSTWQVRIGGSGPKTRADGWSQERSSRSLACARSWAGSLQGTRIVAIPRMRSSATPTGSDASAAIRV